MFSDRALSLAEQVRDARMRTLALVADLSDEQLMGPRLATLNPLRWEIGHVAWFQERWVLRHGAGRAPLRADGDALYDSSAVPHDVRWDLPLPSRAETLAYLASVQAAVLALLESPVSDELAYFLRLSIFHEDMHTEAFTCARQTLGYPPPSFPVSATGSEPATEATGDTGDKKETGDTLDTGDMGDAGDTGSAGDATIPGGMFLLGASRDELFVFDNEKWAHPVAVRPFAMARTAVTQSAFAAFVDDGGYARRDLWSEAGWRWRDEAHATLPVYWRREAGRLERRHFDRWLPLAPKLPILHVCWFEAEAFCNWSGRRLPSEIEWEVAAAGELDIGTGQLALGKRRYPWSLPSSGELGEAVEVKRRARLDWSDGGCARVDALPEGDSAFGCRQLLGNVWEWTADDFNPYPGFIADPYRDYSLPWFGTHKVLRGGCFATRARLLRNTWRNFYTPDRRDVFAGFRTCARDPAPAKDR